MRLIVILLVLACAGCSSPPRSAESLLPATVDTGWHRTSLRDQAPTLTGTLRAFQATYEGPGKAIVTVQEMRPGLAFEAAQHWHATANSVCFDKDLYFVTVEWQQVDRTALRAFVRDIENAIGDRP